MRVGAQDLVSDVREVCRVHAAGIRDEEALVSPEQLVQVGFSLKRDFGDGFIHRTGSR